MLLLSSTIRSSLRKAVLRYSSFSLVLFIVSCQKTAVNGEFFVSAVSYYIRSLRHQSCKLPFLRQNLRLFRSNFLLLSLDFLTVVFLYIMIFFSIEKQVWGIV